MEMQAISYSKVFPLGNYSNEKISVEIRVGNGENPLDAMAEAKRLVEKSHLFFQQLPLYDRAKQIIDDPLDNTGREIEKAKEVIATFEANYPDFLARFTGTRELTQGSASEETGEQDY